MSEIKVNKISPRAACGTVTLGDSGDTFTIPAGATITNSGTANGFGATGAVNWQTTVKTSGFTATAGEGYFVNTTSGPITINLPAGTAGDVVGFKDYAGTFDTNAVTLDLNGSDKAGGSTDNPILGVEGVAVTLVFVDSTQGWLVTDSGLQSDAPGPEFITATGGTITTSGDFKIHKFTGPGTFSVTSGGNAGGSNTVSYLVVAGAGGGGAEHGGGGGAGGFRESKAATDSYTASPLNATSGPTYNLPVAAQDYPITVGGGGAGGAAPNFPGVPGADGNPSVFSTITSTKGGYGTGGNPNPTGNPGGSGGGGSGNAAASRAGGSGNTPPVSPPQGNDGGDGNPANNGGGGGGGGATAAGGNATPGSPAVAGAGGAGATTSITASPVAYGGGGGGGSQGGTGGTAGTGGGGAGAPGTGTGTAGTANTGGGAGGGGSCYGNGGAGGSGVVIIRYKFQ